MADIVERLRFDSARCEMQFSKGVAGNIEEAADEIVRLRRKLTEIHEISQQHLLPAWQVIQNIEATARSAVEQSS